MSRRRSPSPSPTVTLDISPKLTRSSSEDSIRVLHHAVILPNSPYERRVAYLRTYATDAELIRRQQVVIALQPLTYAEELASKRKQLEVKAEKRKQEKAAQVAAKNNNVPEITVAPPSGKVPSGASSPIPPNGKLVKQRPVAHKEKSNIKNSKPIQRANTRQQINVSNKARTTYEEMTTSTVLNGLGRVKVNNRSLK